MSLLLLVALLRVPAAGAMSPPEASTVVAAEAPYADSAVLPQWLLSAGASVPAPPDQPRGDSIAHSSSQRSEKKPGLQNAVAGGIAVNFNTPPRYCLFCALLR